MKTKLLILFLLFSVSAYGQGESNVWCFGDKAGIDFNSSPPVAYNKSNLFSWQASSSICDADGNLLFYSNGETVWDSTHQIMDNGSGLHGSSYGIQSATIMKINKNLYFLFTSDLTSGNNGVRYNIIDMSANQGKGKVVLKNQLIHSSPISSKMLLVSNEAETGVWLILKEKLISKYYAYEIVGTTVSNTPIISTVGNLTFGNGGCMKVSPNLKKVAVADNTSGVEIFDFNRATGELYNPKKVFNMGGVERPYSIEFSPNSKFLYVSTGNAVSASYVFQFDISLPTEYEIQRSQVIIADKAWIPASGFQGYFSAQLGPDNKIYIAVVNEKYVARINNPNVKGIDCDFEEEAIFTGRQCLLGLPNFYIGHIPVNKIYYTNNCFGDTTEFSSSYDGVFDSVSWNFDDAASLEMNLSHDTAPTHIFTDTGTYRVCLVRYKDTCTDTIYKLISIFEYPDISLGADTTVCEGEEVMYNLTQYLPGNITWSDKRTGAFTFIKNKGMHWAKIERNGCVTRDTMYLGLDSNYSYHIPDDTTICAGDTLMLDVGEGAETYSWSSGSTLPKEYFKFAGKYYITITNGVCIQKDSITVNVSPKPLFSLGTDTTICGTDSITLSGGDNVNYEWNNGEKNKQLTVKTAGEYILIQSSAYCSYADTITIATQQPPALNIGRDTVLCEGEKVIIGETVANGIDYTWSHASTGTSQVVVGIQDEYSVVVYDGVCYAYDTIYVGVYSPQSISLGQDSSLCEGTETELDVTINRGKYLWSDGVQAPVRTIKTTGVYTVNITDSVCQYTDDITLTFKPTPPLNLGPDTVLCQDEIHQVSINSNWEKVNWADGNTAFTRIFTTEGRYKVVVTYLNCTQKDSVRVDYHPPLPDLDLGEDKDVCDPLFYPLQSNYKGYYPLVWNTGGKGNYIEVTETGEYIVSTLPHRCGQASDTIGVTFLRELCNLHIPNAFSPNGDGVNDYFFPVGYQMEIENMKIYNRWGELLYDNNQPWDGRYKGAKLNNGTYLFIVIYKKEYRGAKKREVVKGTIQITR